MPRYYKVIKKAVSLINETTIFPFFKVVYYVIPPYQYIKKILIRKEIN